MRHVIYALVPAIIASYWFFGVGILINIVIACVTAMLTEFVALRLRGRPVRAFLYDYSAIVTALLLALCLPPLTVWWITATGVTWMRRRPARATRAQRDPMPSGPPARREVHIMRRTTALFLVSAILCGAASATVYTATNSAELVSMAASLQPGDTLLLAPGVYDVSSLYLNGLHGNATNWITIRGMGPGRPVIRGTALQNVINIDGSDYLRLEDLEITHAGGIANIDGIKFNVGYSSSHIIIDNCYLHDLTGNGIGSQSDHVESLCVRYTEIAYVQQNGIYLGYPSPLRTVGNTLIDNCYIHHTSQSSSGVPTSTNYGIQIKQGSYGSTIRDCVMHDVGGTARAAIAVYYTKLAGGETLDRFNVVRDNVLWNVRNEGIFAANSAVIQGNVVIDAVTGINVNQYDGNVMDNLYIRNNTTLRCDRGFYMRNFDQARASVELVNNLALTDSSSDWTFRMPVGQGSATVSNNVHVGPIYIPGVSATGFTAAPSLAATVVDPYGAATAVNLYPKVGSAVIDAGMTGVEAAEDFNGLPMNSGSAPDVGAYEWGGESNPGWTIAAGLKQSAAAPMTPAFQEVDMSEGGVVSVRVRSQAPVGSTVMILASVTGTSASGVPVLVDAMTYAPWDQGTYALFSNYLVPVTQERQVIDATFTIPPTISNEHLSLYQAAVALDGNFNPIQASNWVRARVRP